MLYWGSMLCLFWIRYPFLGINILVLYEQFNHAVLRVSLYHAVNREVWFSTHHSFTLISVFYLHDKLRSKYTGPLGAFSPPPPPKSCLMWTEWTNRKVIVLLPLPLCKNKTPSAPLPLLSPDNNQCLLSQLYPFYYSQGQLQYSNIMWSMPWLLD